jgi:hypothetical protein
MDFLAERFAEKGSGVRARAVSARKPLTFLAPLDNLLHQIPTGVWAGLWRSSGRVSERDSGHRALPRMLAEPRVWMTVSEFPDKQ